LFLSPCISITTAYRSPQKSELTAAKKDGMGLGELESVHIENIIENITGNTEICLPIVLYVDHW
jgi:hypothetical protein